MKEVLNALEELAMNYDQKLLELQQARQEHETSTGELTARTARVAEVEAEVHQV